MPKVYTVEVYQNGVFCWYLNGKKHREDGPAVEWANGDKFWYQNDKLHRIDGPAVEYYGNKYWYQNGKYHREDGPAVEFSNGCKWWYIKGKEYSEEKFLKQMKNISSCLINEIIKIKDKKYKLIEIK